MPETKSTFDLADEDADHMRPFFEEMPAAELVNHCVRLYYESRRLRRELDDANGVIR